MQTPVRNAVGIWMALCLLLGLTLAAPAQAALKGDSNNDGVVNVSDVVAVLQMIVNPTAQITSQRLSVLDLAPARGGGEFGDGGINVGDAVAILRLVVGLDTQAKYASDESQTPPQIEPGIRFTLSTPRGTYEIDDAIPFHVTLRNETAETATWRFTSGCQIELKVVDEEGVVHLALPQACTLAVTEIVLQPGEEKVWEYTWLPASGDREPKRRHGVYTAHAKLITEPGEPEYKASTTFQIKEITEPVPLPDEDPATFDLTTGRADHYVNPATAQEETIRFGEIVERDGQAYTRTSLTPDGAREVLLRLDGEGQLRQSTHGVESIRLKLHASVGDSWIFDYGTEATATLVSHDAKLKTPGGIYSDLLQFDFFVGPDAGWTEWVHPKGFWVGYTRNTIAGPVDFRITNRDLPGTPQPGYTAKLSPDSTQVSGGGTIQFQIHVYDPDGSLVTNPGTVTWSADDSIGTIDANGLFTARESVPNDAVTGQVRAVAFVNESKVEAAATVTVGTYTPPPPRPEPAISIEPSEVKLRAGATQQFQLKLLIDAVPDEVRWSADAEIGVIDQNGLFTAKTGLSAGVKGQVYADVRFGDAIERVSAQVYVEPEAGEPTPLPDVRLAYLERGSIQAGPSPTLGPSPAIQVTINGDMPDPSWAYDRTEVKVDGDTIFLYPYIRRVHDGPALTVLEPFEASVIVQGLRSDTTYTIHAVGYDTTLTTTAKP